MLTLALAPPDKKGLPERNHDSLKCVARKILPPNYCDYVCSFVSRQRFMSPTKMILHSNRYTVFNSITTLSLITPLRCMGSTEARALFVRIMSALESLLFAQARILWPLATNISTLPQFSLFRMQMDRTSDGSWVSVLSQGFCIITKENSKFEEDKHRSDRMSSETAWGFLKSCDHYWR